MPCYCARCKKGVPDKVHCSSGTSKTNLQRQRNKFCRRQPSIARATRSVFKGDRSHSIIRCTKGNRVRFYTSQGASFRRAVGGSSEERKTSHGSNIRQCSAYNRRNDNCVSRNRSNTELETTGTNEPRSQRWGSHNTGSFDNRSASYFATTRIRNRRIKWQNQVLEKLASVMHAQAIVLENMVQGVPARAAAAEQVGSRSAKSRYRPPSSDSRRQLSSSTLASRQSARRNNRSGRSSSNSRRQNQNRHT